MRILWRAIKVPFATAIALATLFGPLAFFFPELRSWFSSQVLIAWVLAVLLVLVVAGLVDALARKGDRLQTTERRLDAIKQQFETMKSRVEDAEQQLETTKSRRETTEQRLKTMKMALDAAEKRLSNPSEHDQRQSREILEDLPWERGAVAWLEGSSMKQWDDEQSKALYSLDRKWTERFFDLPPVQTAFEDLRTSLRALTSWMSGNGFPLATNAELAANGRNANDPTLYRLSSGAELDGGWAAFDAIRTEGLELAANFIERRRDFERVVRSTRLQEAPQTTPGS